MASIDRHRGDLSGNSADLMFLKKQVQRLEVQFLHGPAGFGGQHLQLNERLGLQVIGDNLLALPAGLPRCGRLDFSFGHQPGRHLVVKATE